MNRKRIITSGESKVEVIYRTGCADKKRNNKLKKTATAARESETLTAEEEQKYISEKKKPDLEINKIKELEEDKLRKLIQAEVSAAIAEIINDAENSLPDNIAKSWSREKQPAEEKWLRTKIKEWMRKNDCEEITDLKCSPETINALVLLRSRLKQSFSLQSIKYRTAWQRKKPEIALLERGR